MIEIDEVLYRWLKGISERKIAQSLGVSRNTIKKIVAQAKAAGLKRASEPAMIEPGLDGFKGDGFLGTVEGFWGHRVFSSFC